MELNSFYDFYANNWITNIIILVGATFIAVFLAYLVPFLDYKICNKIGLNLQGGVSANKNSSKTAYVRLGILYVAFILYIIALLYLTIFARRENPDYAVRNAGISLFTLTWQGVDLPDVEFIEFYLNVMMFIPMGYMLPYLFRWFRKHAIRRSLFVCFLCSIFIENTQLLTKRGTYDTADVISNTLGGLIGIVFFLQRAYTLTNPDWKKDFKYYCRWKKLHRKGKLYPFAKRMYVSRISLLATSEEEIWEYYAIKMGFQLKKIIVSEEKEDTYFLFTLGKSQIEVHCLNKAVEIPEQNIMLAYYNLETIKNKLSKAGIETSNFNTDVYTKHRTFDIKAPDNVTITFIEF